MFPLLTSSWASFSLLVSFSLFMNFWSFMINEGCAKCMYRTRDVAQG